MTLSFLLGTLQKKRVVSKMCASRTYEEQCQHFSCWYRQEVVLLVWLKGGAIFCYFGVVSHTNDTLSSVFLKPPFIKVLNIFKKQNKKQN